MSDTNAATAAQGDQVTQNLAAAFAAQDTPVEVDNSIAEPAAEPVVEPPAPPADEPKDEEAKADEPKADEPETGADDAEEETEVDPDAPVELLTADEIKAKFPRNASKELLDLAGSYSDQARKGQEVLTKIGGEPFVEPLSKMVTALQSEIDPEHPELFAPFFEGTVEAVGAEGLRRLLGQSVFMAFVQGPSWLENPDTKAFGQDLALVVDSAVQGRFGVPMERLERMAELDKIGVIDKIEGWLANNYVPQDELDELLEVQNNPTLKKMAEELTAAKRQLTNPAKPDTAEPEEDSGSFRNFATEQVTQHYETAVWKNSPLKDITTDTDEVKETKRFFREALIKDAVEELERTAGKQLVSGFKAGKQHTAVYRGNLLKALPDVVKATRPASAIAERTLAKLYGKTRNATLIPTPPKDADAVPAQAPLTPTVPTDFKPADKPKSAQDVQKNLQQWFETNG